MPSYSFIVTIEAPDDATGKSAYDILGNAIAEHSNAGAFEEGVNVTVGDTTFDHERDEQIREMASDEYHRDGELEIDDGAIISEGDDNGAYVMAWRWVDFGDTALDKYGDFDEDAEEEAA